MCIHIRGQKRVMFYLYKAHTTQSFDDCQLSLLLIAGLCLSSRALILYVAVLNVPVEAMPLNYLKEQTGQHRSIINPCYAQSYINSQRWIYLTCKSTSTPAAQT